MTTEPFPTPRHRPSGRGIEVARDSDRGEALISQDGVPADATQVGEPWVAGNEDETRVRGHRPRNNPLGNEAKEARRRGHRKRNPRSMGRFPWVTATEAYAQDMRSALGPNTLRERVAKLLYLGRILRQARERGEVDTTDPMRVGKREVDYLTTWMRESRFSAAYAEKLWEHVGSVLRYRGNAILDTLEARGLWRRPRRTRKPPVVKDAAWFQATMQRLETIDSWRGDVLRFVIAFTWGMGLRPKELRLADRADLDTDRWTFRVMHPKGEGSYGVVGAELDVFKDTRPFIVDYLDVRDRRLRWLGLDPKVVKPLVPNENGTYYSDAGWRNLRVDTLGRLGISPTDPAWTDYRALRRTHGQLLVDRLEASGYKEGSVIEIGSKRLRNKMSTFQEFYADLRTIRARKVAQEAWESTTPIRSD